jgi:isohexenylglutaconyl-CoA hydratase
MEIYPQEKRNKGSWFMSEYETILCVPHPQWVEIWLNRPQARNAMSFKMVDELSDAFAQLDHSVQAVVMRGKGGHFCAGGDVKDMRSLFMQAQSKSTNTAENRSTAEDDSNSKEVTDAPKSLSEQLQADELAQANRKFGTLLNQLQHCPQVLISVLEGSVMGGGFGLACVSDIAIALPSARFALPEVSLGITPAQIAPFVVQRIGLTHSRHLALTAKRFKADDALKYGLIHELCADQDELQRFIYNTLKEVSRCAPQARSVCKDLILTVGSQDLDAVLDQAALDFSHALRHGEGLPGIMAFMSKKEASWQQAWGDLSYLLPDDSTEK